MTPPAEQVRRPQPRNGRATPTPARLLDAAERLFAESGLEGISLRSVAAAAGVNSAAVHYHFGSRQALVEAVLLRRVEAIQERRRELLAALPETDGPGALRGIVEALALPWAEVALDGGRAGRAYVKLLARLQADGHRFVGDVVMSHFGDTYREIGERAARALPELPRPVVYRRLAIVVQSALHNLAVGNRADRNAEAPPARDDEQISELVDFLLGGLSAPHSQDLQEGRDSSGKAKPCRAGRRA